MLDEFAYERRRLVESLIRNGYISKPEVIRAMEKVPRHYFVPEHLRREAYWDCPIEIGEGQTISAPHMVGIMVEKLDLEIDNVVLEIGTGSGYHAVVVAEIVGPSGHVYTVERIKSLAERAKQSIAKCGFSDRITVVVEDGSKGLEKYAPYDRIFVTCASPKIPPPLIAQLKDGGKLLIPVGGRYFQDLVGIQKRNNKIFRENYGGCVFVPLIGEHGFK